MFNRSMVRRANGDLETAIVVVAVRLAMDCFGSLLESQCPHQAIVKSARGRTIAYRQIDVVDADQLGRGVLRWSRTATPYHAALSSEVQCAHLVAASGILLKQYGQSLSAGAAGAGLTRRFICLTRMNIANATMRKSIIVLMNEP